MDGLYDFKLNYPNVDLWSYLTQTTPYFQRTIEISLQNIAEERGHGQILLFGTTSSLDMDYTGYCKMDPETLLLRLKQLRVKARLDKSKTEKNEISVYDDIVSKKQKMSTHDLVDLKNKFKALKQWSLAKCVAVRPGPLILYRECFSSHEYICISILVSCLYCTNSE